MARNIENLPLGVIFSIVLPVVVAIGFTLGIISYVLSFNS